MSPLNKTTTHIGETAVDYCNKVTTSVNVSNMALFGGSINSRYQTNYSTSSKQAFASYQISVQRKRVRITAPIDTIKKYLSKQFLDDVKTQSPNYIIQHYGTHLLTDISLGGRLDIMYRSSTTSINRSSVVEAGMAFNIKKIFNLDIKGSTETTLANKNTEQMLTYHTIGGNPSKGLEGQVNIGSTQPTINISEWLSSTNTTNMALIDAQQGSLVPIYALVDDFIIKIRLRTAVNVYLQQKAFKCTYYTVPVYRFHTKESWYRHFLTIDTEEVPKVDTKGWRAEGVRFKIYPPTIQPEGTVPLYRFKSTDAAMRLFFSTNKNEIPEGQYRFYFDKIIGYVHTAENHPLGSVPLYKYSTSVNDSGHRYFYTTDQNEMGPNGKDGFLSNGIACYVFMP